MRKSASDSTSYSILNMFEKFYFDDRKCMTKRICCNQDEKERDVVLVKTGKLMVEKEGSPPWKGRKSFWKKMKAESSDEAQIFSRDG